MPAPMVVPDTRAVAPATVTVAGRSSAGGSASVRAFSGGFFVGVGTEKACAPVASTAWMRSEARRRHERLLGIGRALAVEPRFLMLDEPAAGMNAEEVEQLVDLIGRIRDRFGCGVLVVEHNMAVIMSLCERVQVIDHGATIAIGTPEDVADDPEVRRAYLGEEDDDLPPEEAVSDGPGGEARP